MSETGEMAERLRELAAFAEDENAVPRTHVGQLQL